METAHTKHRMKDMEKKSSGTFSVSAENTRKKERNSQRASWSCWHCSIRVQWGPLQQFAAMLLCLLQQEGWFGAIGLPFRQFRAIRSPKHQLLQYLSHLTFYNKSSRTRRPLSLINTRKNFFSVNAQIKYFDPALGLI